MNADNKYFSSRVSFSDSSFDDYVFPDLIRIQRNSYDLLVYGDVKNGKRGALYNTFKSIFPIEENSGRATLEFIDCSLAAMKHSEYECIRKSITYSAPLRALLRMVIWEVDEESGERTIKNIKEQEVYVGDIPVMTTKGTFIVNGVERVVVSQLHRSPGVFFDSNKSKSYDSKLLYIAKIIPYRGSWLDIEFDAKDLLFFRIDKKRKLPILMLLRALQLSNEDILNAFYDVRVYKRKDDGWEFTFFPEEFVSKKLSSDLVNSADKSIVARAGSLMSIHAAKKLQEQGLRECFVSDEGVEGSYLATNIVDESTQDVLVAAGVEITSEILHQLKICDMPSINIIKLKANSSGFYMRDSMFACDDITTGNALLEIYNVMRPGETPTVQAAQSLLNEMFFDGMRYDLSPVGRMKIALRLGLEWKEDDTVLKKEDIISTIAELMSIRDGNSSVDDIDDLSNRRVRSVGEFIENQLRLGLVRMQKVIIEHMSTINVDVAMPFDLINSKILMAVIKEFFTSSSLSQFMDQTNPLSEITHKRRLSALGPGGLTKDRAGFEVRDVHTTHYGRICPIETPEGQNIGLISSLATCARINKYGFIETPYKKVKDGIVSSEIKYLSTIEERNNNIAQANAALDANARFIDERICCRNSGEVVIVERDEVNYIDLTPKQVVSVAASLIPFLENNDANRALMGSNMQRQAVPLLKAEVPLVGTGMEALIARGSGALVISDIEGYVSYVDSSRIMIASSSDQFHVDTYELCKFQKSNDNTCVNQKTLVTVGDYVRKGDVIADGPATHNGELALGRNLTVAFMSWKGYNFEDSIVISNKVIEDDMFTSIHIEEFECVARDTRLGPEEVTRDIPNVGEEFLCHLDEYGLVHVGAEVEEGNILVGKVTPKSESPVSPEEKLLRAIFAEKAIDMRDTSLYLPPGVSGKVVDVRVFLRRGIEHDGRVLLIGKQQIQEIKKKWECELSVITSCAYQSLKNILIGQKLTSKFLNYEAGFVIVEELLNEVSKSKWWEMPVKEVESKVQDLRQSFDNKASSLKGKYEFEIDKVQSSDDDLSQGVLKVIKVFVAMRHGLQPGDKMAGRHGNKGVISQIVAKEDMPYMQDGTPVDIVLNCHSIPSRMNIGQILETHLGGACFKLRGKLSRLIKDNAPVSEIRQLLLNIYYKDEEAINKINNLSDEELLDYSNIISNNLSLSAPVFESPKEDEISHFLKLADLDVSGQEVLYDGAAGVPFDRKVTVGNLYMLKLHHLVDDKMHARSVGPYSLITQQPLGGKSYFGGQRFGEMECWALQAYGASYTLQEMLTIKSDDVVGRVNLYNSIIRNDNNYTCGVPESFHVMLNELRALCLDIQLYRDDVETN